MRTKTSKGYIFLGASIRGRDEKEALEIGERIKKISAVLDKEGYDYDAELILNADIKRGQIEAFKVPDEFYRMPDSLIESVSALRPYDHLALEDGRKQIKNDIALSEYCLSLMKKASGCIWDVTRSNLGVGFEIAMSMYKMKKYCLVFFDRPTISSMLSGSTSRLLTVKHWDAGFADHIRDFLQAKLGKGKDQIMRFNATQELVRRIEEVKNELKLSNEAETIRTLIECGYELLKRDK